ncbi:MAG: NADH:ubiquinone reductase (Na(+)-transporting) subunit F, partial [Planctomycetota bacterium]
LEHHMFPLVPYHRLPELHEAIKADCPPAYPSLLSAWQEIIPAVLRQVRDPAYHVKRELPDPPARTEEPLRGVDAEPDAEGWLEVCAAADLGLEDVIRFDHGPKTFALVRNDRGQLHATDGICTHGNTHLSEGLVKGNLLECPKHNGRFQVDDGSPARAPICRGLATYPIEERSGRIWLNILQAGGAGARQPKPIDLRVVSSRSVATFIKELVFEPVDEHAIEFQPGDYLQFEIPPYEQIDFRDFDIPEPYATVWERQHVFENSVSHDESGRRNNYSIASNTAEPGRLVFNVRIATPPAGQACPPGVGSSYMYSLKPGDVVRATGPYGDFHIKPTKKEMVYIGGGAGMAPLRAHLSHLFETATTERKISYWYGARSKQEIYYADYFEDLSKKHSNFRFYVALSEPSEDEAWGGLAGFIHNVVREQYLKTHPNVQSVEFYLCGPPAMIKACTKMLSELGVSRPQIAFDEF